MNLSHWTLPQLQNRERDLSAEVADSEAALKDPASYVSRKCLVADRAYLRRLRAELKRRGIAAAK